MEPQNFPFYKDGKEFWYSRSIVCSGYVFCRFKGDWYVLAALRGKNQTNPYRWNVPGGFLDHNETLKQCVAREVYEETGLKLDEGRYKFFHVNDKPHGNLQHVVFSFWANLGTVKGLPVLTRDHNEPGETISVEWVKVAQHDISLQGWLRERRKLEELSRKYPTRWVKKYREQGYRMLDIWDYTEECGGPGWLRGHVERIWYTYTHFVNPPFNRRIKNWMANVCKI